MHSIFLICTFLFIFSCIHSKVFERCEFGRVLLTNDIEKSELDKWICLANHTTKFNSSRIYAPGSEGRKYFGIFVFSQMHCLDDYKPDEKINTCDCNCTELADDDLENDIKCAKALLDQNGSFFLVWKHYYAPCVNKSLDSYVDGCDFENGVAPTFISNSKKNVTIPLNSTNQLISCAAEGTLPIQLKWFRHDMEILPSQFPMELEEDTTKNLTILSLKLPFVTIDEYGQYTCQARNAYGLRRRDIFIQEMEEFVNNEPKENAKGVSVPILIGIAVISTFLVSGTVFHVYQRCKPVKTGVTPDEIRAFFEGLRAELNPEFYCLSETSTTYTTVSEIYYSQPYCNLELEGDLEIDWNAELGSGEFGVVYKGYYKPQQENENDEGLIRIPVAVKTIRKSHAHADDRRKQLLALMDEIKVMNYLSQDPHPNIISVIGAQTTKLESHGKLYLVLEYCSLGNLFSYLSKLKSESSNRIRLIPEKSKASYYRVEFESSIPGSEYLIDLIRFAHQIAAAMNYLTERRIIHADLAARNVLVIDEFTVKLSDFGLSKRLRDSQEYVRNHQPAFPWQWWSIESLRDFTFTHKSDAWSYGVLLWEMFTLGQIPYAEENLSAEFMNQLENGHRLARPELAPEYIWDIMTKCWNLNPVERPTFSLIYEQLGKTLTELLNTDDVPVFEDTHL